MSYTTEQGKMIEAILDYASAHYEEDGWDIVIESWDDTNILEFFEGRTTFEEIVDAIREYVKVIDEYRNEIRHA